MMSVPSPTRCLCVFFNVPSRRGGGVMKAEAGRDVLHCRRTTYPDRLLETQVTGAMRGILFQLSALDRHSPPRLHGAVRSGKVTE